MLYLHIHNTILPNGGHRIQQQQRAASTAMSYEIRVPRARLTPSHKVCTQKLAIRHSAAIIVIPNHPAGSPHAKYKQGVSKA